MYDPDAAVLYFSRIQKYTNLVLYSTMAPILTSSDYAIHFGKVNADRSLQTHAFITLSTRPHARAAVESFAAHVVEGVLVVEEVQPT